LRLPVGLLTVPTSRAGAARVSGIYQVDGNTGVRGLVADVRPQLEEGPRVPLVAMCPTNRCSLADSRQILKRDCLAGHGGFLNELLANNVVGAALEAGIALPHAADTALGALGADLLETLSAHVVAIANKVEALVGDTLALAVSCQVGDAQRPAVWLCFRRRVTALADLQVVGATRSYRISAANFPHGVYRHRKLAGTAYEATDSAAFQGVERDAVQAHQSVHACVVADAAAWAQSGAGVAPPGFHCLDCLDCLDCLGSGTDGQLRAQPKSFTCLTLDAMARGVCIGDALIPTYLRNPASRHVKALLSRGQRRAVPVYIQIDEDSAAAYCAHQRCVFYNRQAETERRVGKSSPY